MRRVAGGGLVVRRVAGGALVAVAVTRGLEACVVCALDVAVGVADIALALALVDADSSADVVLRLGWLLLHAAIAARVITASAAARLRRLPPRTRPRYLRVTIATAGRTCRTCRAGPVWTPWKTNLPFSSPHGLLITPPVSRRGSRSTGTKVPLPGVSERAVVSPYPMSRCAPLPASVNGAPEAGWSLGWIRLASWPIDGHAFVGVRLGGDAGGAFVEVVGFFADDRDHARGVDVPAVQ